MNGNGQWKWIAGIFAALMIGLVPSFIALSRAPTEQDFQEIQRLQTEGQVKLAVLAAQNSAMLKVIEDARERIILLQTRQP